MLERRFSDTRFVSEDQAGSGELLKWIKLAYDIAQQVGKRSFKQRLVVTPHETNATAVQQDQALIEVLAQSQRWFEQWLRGEVASVRAIAQSPGKSERHVSQVMRAAFLAPDLVEALLRGRRPARLSVRGVMKELPWDWNEQRRRFGLAAGINDNLSVRD